LHDLPVCERPAGAGVVSPNSSLQYVSTKAPNSCAEAVALLRRGLMGSIELARLILASATKKGEEFTKSRDNESAVLITLGSATQRTAYSVSSYVYSFFQVIVIAKNLILA